MVNQNTLNLLEAYGFGSDIDAFETYVMELQDAAGSGNPLVTDAQYDDYVALLKQVKPESVALNRNWESADNEFDNADVYLQRYGMKSIRTIMDLSELEYFKNIAFKNGPIDLLASSKINGYGVRAVYKYGNLVSGSTRGRYKKGRDITRHLKQVLPEFISELSEVPLTEIRGELYVDLNTFESIRHLVKTPLSAVTSLSRESATDTDIKMLSFRAYQVFSDDLTFESLGEKFQFLRECGFETPYAMRISNVNYDEFDEAIEGIIERFTGVVEGSGLPYDNDGIVVAVDNLEMFNSLGNEGNTMLGNFALKVGHWEQNVYSAKILSVEWCYGKRYITPKAIVEGVVTRNGSKVTTVPLYNIGVMQDNGYYPGNDVFFKYGGETGVTLTKADGTPV